MYSVCLYVLRMMCVIFNHVSLFINFLSLLGAVRRPSLVDSVGRFVVPGKVLPTLFFALIFLNLHCSISATTTLIDDVHGILTDLGLLLFHQES